MSDLNGGQSASADTAPQSVRPPFDTFTITLHWITVLMVLALLVSGVLHAQLEEKYWAASLLQVHRSLGAAPRAHTFASRSSSARLRSMPQR
jgi:hypothetical protein